MEKQAHIDREKIFYNAGKCFDIPLFETDYIHKEFHQFSFTNK